MASYRASIYNYVFNSVNAILMIVNGIIMVPLYFKYMSVATYGAWLATGNIIAMLGLLESGFSFVITQKLSFTIAQKDTYKFQILSGANILSAILISSLILVIGLCLSPFITEWININNDIKNEIRIAFIISLCATCLSIFVNIFGAFPQVWQETKQIGIFTTISNIIAIIALIIFLLSGFGVISIALSYIVRAIFNLTFNGTWIINNWKKRNLPKPIYSIKETISLTKDCVYPFLSKVSGTVVEHSQSFIIAHFMNPTLSAVYDITSKICVVACSFVSNINGSFFALMSLTLAGNNKTKSQNVIYNTSLFFITFLMTVALYSICFTEPIINYWVGLDKYGGTLLLILIVFSKILSQIRTFFNNILYSGGFINKSAKLDIVWMSVYIILLILTITKLNIYSIPTSLLVSSGLFCLLYSILINKYLKINLINIIFLIAKSILIIIPFIILHFIFSFDYSNLKAYSSYFIIFSVVYLGIIYLTNKPFIKIIVNKIHNNGK